MMMDVERRIPLTLTVGLLAAALVVGSFDTRSHVPVSAALSMRSASQHFDAFVPVARAVASWPMLSDQEVLELGYLERLRLGLGGPFRLVHQALLDPRLEPGARTRLAWALLDRVRRRDDYVVDPVVLDGLGPWFDSTRAATGSEHLAFIRRTVAEAADPRAGELAVRLAYDVAVAERSVREPASRIAAQVAALERDRLLASRDVDELFERARDERLDVLDELPVGRAERRFRVEAPPAAPLPARLENAAMDAVPRLVAELRRLGSEPDEGADDRRSRFPVLGAVAGARLVALGAALPPQTPVAVAMQVLRPSILGEAKGGVSIARRRFATEGANEETLAGGYAALAASGDSARREPALAVLASAVQLRAYAQEEPWFPGMPGPSASEVASRFALREVRFDQDVPSAWRPYYARMLATSIVDLQHVFPAISLSGLGIRFGIGNLPDTALAMHDPGSRVLRLSIATSAGTLAHEFAHDLDWQAARRLYVTGGGYSTDRAMREPRGALSASVRGLAAARVGPNRNGAARARPAELFARDVDWFVAVALAHEGRSNGYLSAVQDATLTGYTAASPRDMIAGAGRALVDALSQMTYVPSPTRDAFLDEWTDPASISPSVLSRRVAELRLPRRTMSRVQIPGGATLSFAPPTEFALCTSVAGAWTPGVRARRELLDLALEARARGIARRWAQWYSPGSRPAWASSMLGVMPYDQRTGERFVSRLRGSLVWELESGGDPGELLVPALAMFRAGSDGCGA